MIINFRSNGQHPERAERESCNNYTHTHYKQGKPAGREERKHASIAYGDVCVCVFGGERKEEEKGRNNNHNNTKSSISYSRNNSSFSLSLWL